MNDDYKSPKFVEWLDKLQQESWQLELIISGFSIFGLLNAFDPIKHALSEAKSYDNHYILILWIVVLVSCAILSFNLIFHVVLRGLWIGALGLRYVSGEIDYDKLNYSSKFTSYLNRKIGTFDKFIARLEDYCSILFALTFLMVFYFISMCLMLGFISLIGYLLNQLDAIWPKITDVVSFIVLFFLLFGLILMIIDFIGQGVLKRKKWTSYIYFPFYWLFNFIGLSFLYRPLVYNFLDNKLGKRLMFLLIPIYLVLLTAASIYNNEANYFSVEESTSESFANSNSYEDLIGKDEYVDVASISSQMITTNHFKVFIDFKDDLDDIIFNFDETLKPTTDGRGLNSNITFGARKFYDKKQRDSISNLYLKTFNHIYKLNIDKIQYEHDFIVSHNQKEQLGFLTYIKFDSLQEGKHILNIERLIKPKNDSLEHVISIPFWYYKK